MNFALVTDALSLLEPFGVFAKPVGVLAGVLMMPGLFGAISEANARVWLVNADGSGDAPTVQAGIDSATAGDQVAVSPGVYSWETQGGSDLLGGSMIRMKSGITLRSVTGAAQTVLDASGQGRVILCSGEDAKSRIVGFTIRRGRPNGNGCQPACFYGSGGGILCRASSRVAIEANIIVDNFASYGGGGIQVDHSSPIVERNVIARNGTSLRGGAVDVVGATAHPMLLSNTIVGNEGGGVSCVGGATATLAQNIVAWNLTNGRTSWGVFCFDSVLTLNCNDLWSNSIDAIGPCIVDSGTGIGLDPQFCAVDPVQGLSFVLQSDSPCLPSGSACGLAIGALGANCGSVATQQRTWGEVKRFYALPTSTPP